MTPLRNAILAALSLAAMAPSANAAAPADFAGIDAVNTFSHAFNNEMGPLNSDLVAQRKTGIRLYRQVFNWEQVEQSKGRYDFTFSGLDRYMEGIAKHRQKVLPILLDAPRWHTARGEKSGIMGRPKSGRALGKFGAALIRRYGPKGSFWKQAGLGKYRKYSAIRSWQLWNEPNLRYYWSDRPNAKQYMTVVKAARKLMKKADRRAEIVSAGIPQSSTKRAVPLKKYLQQMYRNGAKGAFETIAVNAYAKNTRDLHSRLKLVRRVMNGRGDRRARIWITEIGWSDKGDPSPFRKGTRGQAREIKRSIALMRKQRNRLKLRGFVYYQWEDTTPYRSDLDPGLWGFHAGLLTTSGKSKPAHAAYRRAVRGL